MPHQSIRERTVVNIYIDTTSTGYNIQIKTFNPHQS